MHIQVKNLTITRIDGICGWRPSSFPQKGSNFRMDEARFVVTHVFQVQQVIDFPEYMIFIEILDPGIYRFSSQKM